MTIERPDPFPFIVVPDQTVDMAFVHSWGRPAENGRLCSFQRPLLAPEIACVTPCVGLPRRCQCGLVRLLLREGMARGEKAPGDA